MITPKTVLMCLGGLLLSAAGRAFGQTAASTTTLPPIGLAVSETVQVNVVNTAQSSGGVAASCAGSVAFYDAAGSVVGTPAIFTVGTGQLFSTRLPYVSATGTGPRMVIQSAITLGAAPSTISVLGAFPPTPPCRLVYSLETYDSTTGVTHAYVSGLAAQGPSANK
jgi:hypothetical protein